MRRVKSNNMIGIAMYTAILTLHKKGISQRQIAKMTDTHRVTVSDMLYNMHIAKADNSYHKLLKQLINYDLLILDELGFKQLPKYSTDDFFNVISKRYEYKLTIITTNKELTTWNDIFDDEALTGAIVDRVMYHATIFNIKGKSYIIKSKVENMGVSMG